MIFWRFKGETYFFYHCETRKKLSYKIQLFIIVVHIQSQCFLWQMKKDDIIFYHKNKFVRNFVAAFVLKTMFVFYIKPELDSSSHDVFNTKTGPANWSWGWGWCRCWHRLLQRLLWWLQSCKILKTCKLASILEMLKGTVFLTSNLVLTIWIFLTPVGWCVIG